MSQNRALGPIVVAGVLKSMGDAWRNTSKPNNLWTSNEEMPPENERNERTHFYSPKRSTGPITRLFSTDGTAVSPRIAA